AARAGELHDGELVLLAGFGGGMSVGAALLRWYGN
ncbi:3-oxoacyl-[acyl-carrier-protein] synthase III C-terminal domain-containing protein, partial [Actinoplanes sp. NPDC048791]